MEKDNTQGSYKFIPRVPNSHKSSMSINKPKPFEAPISRLKKSILRRLSSRLLGGRVIVPSEVLPTPAEPVADIIGDEYSDPPSILHIESETEEDKKAPEDLVEPTSYESSEMTTLEYWKTGVTKSTDNNQTGQVPRTVSNQLSGPKDDNVKLQVPRSYSTKLQGIKIDGLTRASDSYKDYLCTLFGSLCLVQEIDPKIRDIPPTRIFDLPRPQGLLCILNSHALANKTLVLDLDETLIHEESEGEHKISVALANGINTEVQFR